MAEKLTPQPNMEYIRDLLSPYLDDEVTDEERAQVDVALAGSPELRDELESLRQTVALVAGLPRISAPRPFTLTEADVRIIAPKPKISFTMPSWLGGFAAAAALLACVLALGGLFLTGSFNRGGLVGDIAMAPQQAAEQPAAAPAQEAPAEEQAPPREEAAEIEMELLMETDEAEAEVEQELAGETVEEEKLVVEEKAVEATILAPLPAQATEVADSSSRAEADRSGTGESDVGAQAMPTPTAMAMATSTPSPALAPAPAGELEKRADEPAEAATSPEAVASAVADEPAGGEQSGPANSFAATEEATTAETSATEEDDPAQKEGALELLEIKNQVLQITPGQIYLAGTLDVNEGTVLTASLQRNGNPFSDWAEPATLQTSVETNGRFEFNIVAADSAGGDLFGQDLLKQDLLRQEPATYQIVITSPGTDPPVMTFAYFDTFAAAAATPTPAVTPSPTVLAGLTSRPTDIPNVQPTPGLEPELPFSEPSSEPGQVDAGSVPVIWIIVILGVVVAIVTGVIMRRVKK